MIDVSVTRSPGQTIYAFPDASEGFSLADWTTHRVLLTEGTAPDTGIYTGQLDETKATLWRFFEGASQPTDWDKSKGYFSLPGSAGDYLLTITVTDFDTSAPIQNAYVTLTRSGQRETMSVNVNGVATLGVDAATWTYIVRAGGYASKTGTVVVSANQSLAVELDAIVIPSSTGDTITAYYICLDEEGQPQSGVDVCLYADEVIDADSGIALSGVERTVTSDANGYATFTNVPTGYQYVVTVGYSRQYRINIPVASTSPFAMRPVIR